MQVVSVARYGQPASTALEAILYVAKEVVMRTSTAEHDRGPVAMPLYRHLEYSPRYWSDFLQLTI